MKKSHLLLLAIILLLVTACSARTRSIALDWLRGSGQTAAREGVSVAAEIGVEAVKTNVPLVETVAVVAIGTGVPRLQTLVAEKPPEPTAVTNAGIIDIGRNALATRLAEQPGYRCPDVPLSLDIDLNGAVDIGPEQLAAALAAGVPDNPLIRQAKTFVDVTRANDVNVYFIVAWSAWETSWGVGPVVTERHNLFAYGATHACPLDCALSFASAGESIERVVPAIKADYLTPGGRYYNGSTLAGLQSTYTGATDQWAMGVATIMNLLRQNTPCP
ncbi:MAG: hypothetical protein LC131_14925 [Anaerolineae bacterium]|nr:hypothetical protein [Anaerolineae bacterium]